MSWPLLEDRLTTDSGLPGQFVTTPFTAIVAPATTPANSCLLTRFAVHRVLEVDRIHFRVQLLDAADPAIDVGIYRWDGGADLTRVASAGALTGVVNTAGRKVISLTAPAILEPLQIYYAAYTTAGAVHTTNLQSSINAGAAELIGDTPGLKLQMNIAQAPPLPATLVGPVNNQATAPILFLRERGT